MVNQKYLRQGSIFTIRAVLGGLASPLQWLLPLLCFPSGDAQRLHGRIGCAIGVHDSPRTRVHRNAPSHISFDKQLNKMMVNVAEALCGIPVAQPLPSPAIVRFSSS